MKKYAIFGVVVGCFFTSISAHAIRFVNNSGEHVGLYLYEVEYKEKPRGVFLAPHSSQELNCTDYINTSKNRGQVKIRKMNNPWIGSITLQPLVLKKNPNTGAWSEVEGPEYPVPPYRIDSAQLDTWTILYTEDGDLTFGPTL